MASFGHPHFGMAEAEAAAQACADSGRGHFVWLPCMVWQGHRLGDDAGGASEGFSRSVRFPTQR